MCSGPTPNFARTPSASRICPLRRSICTTRVPMTHCARSLSGVQMQTFSTRSSCAARYAADASASSASSSTIARLVSGPEVVAKRLDDVIGRDADVRRALLQHLDDGAEHAGHGSERLVDRRDLCAGGAAQAVEVSKE